jgi:hypothetical protein
MTWIAGLVVAIAFAAAVWIPVTRWGAHSWQEATRALESRLDAGLRAPLKPRYSAAEIGNLPAPVQRYLRAVLKDGQPVITGVRLAHEGTFNMSANAQSWKPFRSTQRVVIDRPGLVWNGCIDVLPGVPVRVHDVYLAGEGLLRASLIGLVPMAHQQDRGDLARGELMRFLAEAAWYPTALLPRDGVSWHPIDDHSARVTLTDGDLAAMLTFRFDDQGLIDTVAAESRARIAGDRVEYLAWGGRFWNYAEREGMRVPLEGEVAWITPQGQMPYWRGRLSSIEFDFAPVGAVSAPVASQGQTSTGVRQ